MRIFGRNPPALVFPLTRSWIYLSWFVCLAQEALYTYKSQTTTDCLQTFLLSKLSLRLVSHHFVVSYHTKQRYGTTAKMSSMTDLLLHQMIDYEANLDATFIKNKQRSFRQVGGWTYPVHSLANLNLTTTSERQDRLIIFRHGPTG